METIQRSTGLFSPIIISLIIFYQKVISPFKGYSCAHCYEHGGPSCSEYVKGIVLKKGVLSGFNDIRSRFQACKQASIKIHRRRLAKESGLLDCGFDGCADVGSCFDTGGVDGSGRTPIIIVLPVGFLMLLLIVGGSFWYQGPRVNSIDIRLIEAQQEVREKGLALLLGGKLPDYQVIFTVNGNKVTTQTLNNRSAKAWLSLEPKARFKMTDIERITIVNKQVLKDEILDVIESPSEHGKGKLYEYRLDEGLVNF